MLFAIFFSLCGVVVLKLQNSGRRQIKYKEIEIVGEQIIVKVTDTCMVRVMNQDYGYLKEVWEQYVAKMFII